MDFISSKSEQVCKIFILILIKSIVNLNNIINYIKYIMGYFEDVLDWIDEDFIFLIKYGLVIANFISIFIILYFKRQ